jgi:putative membrane protein
MPDLQLDPRVLLALERTLLAWTRTALALMGFGFVTARLSIFLREMSASPVAATPGGSRWIGLVLVALGGIVQAVALVSHVRSLDRLRRGEDLPIRLISPVTILGGLLILIAIVSTLYLATI